MATFSDLFARLDPDPRLRGKQFAMAAVAEAPLLTDAQIAVISSQMGLTPVDFDVARWVSPSRGRPCDDHGVM